MKTLVIIQARMGSTRLPGKVLMPLKGKALVLRLIENLRNNRHNAEVVVATSINKENDILADTLSKEGIRCFRGSENDVLSRFLMVIEKEQPDIVIRATADDPLMSSECMDIIIDELIKQDLDYAVMKDLPRGITTEVFKAAALVKVGEMTDLSDRDREHVTIYLYEHKELFRVGYIEALKKYYGPDIELTIDTMEEFNKIQALYDKFGENINLEEVIKYCRSDECEKDIVLG